jgi:ribulose-phosphate 3-epimerase
MVVEPDHLLTAFRDAGATHITVHAEACRHLHRSLQAIRALGCRVGVALNPGTPAAALSEVLHLLDLVLVMTVNPGFGGQAFLPETLPKIRQVRAMSEAAGRALDIVVDGGINAETAPLVLEAGANVLVAGSAVFNSRASVAESMDMLRWAIKG